MDKNIFDDIKSLHTITDYLEKAYIKKMDKGFSVDGWDITIEYESGDDLVLVGRGIARRRGAIFYDHKHENEVNIITLLKGSLEIKFTNTKIESIILDKPLDSKVIPPDNMHEIISLEEGTEAVFITIPADPGYSAIYRGK